MTSGGKCGQTTNQNGGARCSLNLLSERWVRSGRRKTLARSDQRRPPPPKPKPCENPGDGAKPEGKRPANPLNPGPALKPGPIAEGNGGIPPVAGNIGVGPAG